MASWPTCWPEAQAGSASCSKSMRAARVAGVKLARGSMEEAERYLALATRNLESVPAGRAGRAQAVLAVVRMRLARQRGDLEAVAGEAQRLLAPAVSADPAEPELGGD